MAESTLNDVVKKLDDVKSTIKDSNSSSATQQVKAQEVAKEAALKEDEKIGIFQDIADKLNLFKGMKKPKDEKGTIFSKIFGKLGIASLATTIMSGIASSLSTAFVGLKSTFAGVILKKLASLVGPAAIITGLALAIKDGLIGWTKSNDWGVSSISGFLGGFFGGAADGGIKNAFAKAGQFALIGAGIGSVVPVVGTLVGGLVGAAIGGILGFIGGRKLAEGFDGIGAWFKEKFDNLILAPIKAVWDTIAPDWVKSIDFEWSDLFPPALTKLFGGEYFTVDFPAFTWTDLFPQFLVDLFNNVAIAGKETTFEWKDLLPKFITKFFAGEYSTEGSFQWSDLLPEFINKIIGVAKTAWADTDFTYKSLLPGFITKLIEGTEITPTGTFSWKDLVPEFIWKLTDGAVAAAKTEEGFKWSNLLPDWMIGAWESTKGLARQTGAFDWRGLLPKFIADLFPTDGPLTISAGLTALSSFDWRSLLPKFIADLFPGITDKPLTIAAGLKEVGSWNWKSLLPKFLVDFIDDPTQITKENYSFSWKDLLPTFMVNLIEGKPLFGGEGLAGEVGGTGVNLEEKAQEMMESFSPEKILEKINFDDFNFGKILGINLNMGDKLKGMLGTILGMPEFRQGGLVGFTGPAMLHGSPGKPELVLDNMATSQFLQAARLLTNSQAIEQLRMGNGSPVIINNVDNSQRNPVVSNQATQIKVPDNPRPSDPTMLAVQGSQMFN